MPLTPGTLLGLYEILAPIWEGGLGDVYKAREHVAIWKAMWKWGSVNPCKRGGGGVQRY